MSSRSLPHLHPHSRFLATALRLGLALGALVLTGPLRAQSAAPAISAEAAPAGVAVDAPSPSPTADSATAAAAGPWLPAPAFATTRPAAAGDVRQERARLGFGKPLALVGVGLAVVGVGLLVGDGEGTAIAAGGGLLSLFGLYRFLQ